MLALADERRVLILLKIELMLVPMVVRTKMAAAPISTRRSEYSTMSWPCSSRMKFLIIKSSSCHFYGRSRFEPYLKSISTNQFNLKSLNVNQRASVGHRSAFGISRYLPVSPGIFVMPLDATASPTQLGVQIRGLDCHLQRLVVEQ